MNGKRSYLDNLNAGRQRRPESALDEIHRTLDRLESRLGPTPDTREPGRAEERDVTRRIQRLSEEAAASYAAGANRAPAGRGHDGSSRASLERIAHDIEDTRRQEEQLSSISGIARELQALRDDMRAVVSSNLRREFGVLREELAHIMAAVPQSPITAELTRDFEQLSRSIAQLAERSDDKSTKMLRLELEQVKGSLANLAREETVLALDRRWDDLEDRLSAGVASDPGIEALHTRLEEISAAVKKLPESLSLRSLEERVRTLAGSLDQFAVQRDGAQPDLYAMIDERLDEISRAITASAALAQTPSFDANLLERIEARISSLANQINELVEDKPSRMIVERLNALSERVDGIARRIDVPEQAVERLAEHIDLVSSKLDTVSRPGESDHLFRSLEDRFTHLSGLMEQRQEDVIQQGHSFMQDMERRLQEIADRLEHSDSAEDTAGLMAALDRRFADLAARIEDVRHEPGDNAAMRALEARLDDITRRLQSSASASHGIDPEVIRNLEAQVASLSAHLAQPGRIFPEFDDLAPRLEGIERSIGESRAAMLEAARQAAAQAVQELGLTQAEAADGRLNKDLERLEALTRRADEHNTKTFEAIHDTLLKIVERLGSLETVSTDGKIAVNRTPSIDPADRYEEEVGSPMPPPRRTPAEAAAAAAEAALLDDVGTEQPEEGGKRTVLGGLSRAFTARRGRPAAETVHDESLLSVTPEESPAPEVDFERMNEPLEPGSGAPDLNAILRRVRDERGVSDPAPSDTAKADFIAAARRAAQAAAAEAETLKRQRTEPADKSGKFSLGGVLRRHKKQLLLTLGLVVAIAGGAQYVTRMLPRDEPPLIAQSAGPFEKRQLSAEADAPEAADRVAIAPEDASDAREPVPAASEAGDQHIETAAIGSAAEAPPETQDDLQAADQAMMPSSLPPAPQHQETAADEAAIDPAYLDLPEIPSEAGPAALREAASTGDPVALYEIASRYEEGRGVKADITKAAMWYEKAAEQGLAPAQYRMGNMYEKGAGVARDLAKAKMWYQLAAEQGNASAMHNLGVLFAMGSDGVADSESAARWFQEAADLGITDSQYNLGILAAKGVGMPRDLSEAYKWFDIVARSGDADAATKRDELAKVMAPADLAKAQGKAKLWEAREADPEANTVAVPPEWGTDDGPTGSIDMKRAIGNIQLILNRNGFDAGPADGVMGEKTRAAIRAFQKENGMAETGEIDDALVRALLERNEAAQ